MELLTVLILYISFGGFMFLILLFGESPLFENTPIAYIHWFITRGICEGMEYVIFYACGDKGVEIYQRSMDWVLDAMNPLLQITYVVLLLGAFYVYQRYLFPHIPCKYVPAWNKYAGSANVALCMLFFWLASFSDPGTVRERNVDKCLKVYDFDGLVYFKEKQCNTCNLVKPARSKHCSTCKRCVMRSDHHCVWVNNCIGVYNMRWFLGFLASNCLLSFYALTADLLILISQLEDDHGIWTAKFRVPETGELVSVFRYPGKLLEWCSYEYQIEVLMALFSFIIGILVFGFNILHWYLVLTNVTTNEQYKRKQIRKQVKKMENSDQILKKLQNKYDRGVIENVLEVLFPDRFIGMRLEISEGDNGVEKKQE